jgi:hypothetical protein
MSTQLAGWKPVQGLQTKSSPPVPDVMVAWTIFALALLDFIVKQKQTSSVPAWCILVYSTAASFSSGTTQVLLYSNQNQRPTLI